MDGTVAGEKEVPQFLLGSQANSQMIKDYLVAMRANSRQWSANTKGRSEVSHSNKKPHRQKGTGGARQGTLAAPQYKGGGVVFGPKPKFNQHVRINRQEKRAAIRHLLAEKNEAGRLFVITGFEELKTPRTKAMVSLISELKVSLRSVLFVAESEKESGQTVCSSRHDVLRKSVRNIPGAALVLAGQLNGYDLACAATVVMTQGALKELEQQLGAE